jgi:hypothetical protein
LLSEFRGQRCLFEIKSQASGLIRHWRIDLPGRRTIKLEKLFRAEYNNICIYSYNMQFYNSDHSIQKYRRSLPHWSQSGALHFITFRLYDSLPSVKLKALKDEIAIWRKVHPEPLTPEDAEEYTRERPKIFRKQTIRPRQMGDHAKSCSCLGCADRRSSSRRDSSLLEELFGETNQHNIQAHRSSVAARII